MPTSGNAPGTIPSSKPSPTTAPRSRISSSSKLKSLGTTASPRVTRARQLRRPHRRNALSASPCASALDPFSTTNQTTIFLSQLATRAPHRSPFQWSTASEFQIDFDCAASKLDGYRIWVETIRKKITPTPLTITTLPSWLKEPAFKTLVEATDGYVLQVHSVEKPKSFDAPFTLCDPVAAQHAVELAGKINVPFRVALPTYGYLLAFDQSGKFIGLSAEGPNKSWPVDVRVREVRTHPLEMKPRSILGHESPVSIAESSGIDFRRLWITLTGIGKLSGAIVASRFPARKFSWRNAPDRDGVGGNQTRK